VRPPRRIQELRPQIAEAEELLSQDLGRAPTPAEVAADLGCEVSDVLEAMDCPSGADTAWIERLPSLDPGFSHAEAVAMVGSACRRLKPRDRRILRMRFYEQLTQQQIADDLGVTQVQVSRLLQRILRDLRRAIDGPTASAA
jgi:RNA polymerase sigma-B factor